MKKRTFTKLFFATIFLLGIHNTVQAQSPNPPEVLPAIPFHSESDVFSIYSDVYAVNPAAAFVFTGSDAAEVIVLTDNMQYAKIGTGGSPSVNHGSALFTFASPIDIEEYNTFFIDFYAVEQNSFNLRINFNAVQVTVRIATGWNRLELDLNDFRILGADLTQISEIKFTGEGLRNVYIDNIYACMAVHSDLVDAPTTPAPLPAHNMENVLPVFTDTYANEVGVTIHNNTIGTTKKIKGLRFPSESNFDKMIYIKESSGGDGGLNFNTVVNISDYDSLHFDVYPITNTIAMRIHIGAVGTKSNFNIATAGSPNTWNSIDIALDDYLANITATAPDFTNLRERGFWFWSSNGGKRTFFLDNVYFYKAPGIGTGLGKVSSADLVKVYAVNSNIRLESEVEINSVQIFALSGQNIKTIQGAGNKLEINLQNESNGIYIFKISLEDGNSTTKRILKM